MLPIIVTDPPGVVVSASGRIHKFADGLPGLNAGKANNLGQDIHVAVPDTTTYLGSDYYEIGVYISRRRCTRRSVVRTKHLIGDGTA